MFVLFPYLAGSRHCTARPVWRRGCTSPPSSSHARHQNSRCQAHTCSCHCEHLRCLPRAWSTNPHRQADGRLIREDSTWMHAHRAHQARRHIRTHAEHTHARIHTPTHACTHTHTRTGVLQCASRQTSHSTRHGTRGTQHCSSKRLTTARRRTAAPSALCTPHDRSTPADTRRSTAGTPATSRC
jgi:hypothetical protein